MAELISTQHTLKTWINTLRNHLASAYQMINLRRGTMPDNKNAENLAESILSIPFGVEFIDSGDTLELIGAVEYDPETISLPSNLSGRDTIEELLEDTLDGYAEKIRAIAGVD